MDTFFLVLNRLYFQCVLFEASIMLLNFRKKSPQSLPLQFQGTLIMFLKKFNQILFTERWTSPVSSWTSLTGTTFGIYHLTIGYLVSLNSIGACDTFHINIIPCVFFSIPWNILQAFSWCCRSLFCLPLHFHPRRRCEEPAEGHH